jgi:hypothetical protein
MGEVERGLTPRCQTYQEPMHELESVGRQLINESICGCTCPSTWERQSLTKCHRNRVP